MGTSPRARTLVTLALLAAIGSATAAQVPVDRLRDVLGGGRPFGGFGADDPVTSSIDHATPEAPALDDLAPAHWLPLRQQPQDRTGAFELPPGSYAFEAASYCLHAGTHGPGRGDGYLYAPLEGARAGVIRAILQGSVNHPEVPQQEIQVLLWAILARTPVDQMPRQAQHAAAALLAPAQMLELGVGALPVLTPGIWADRSGSLPPSLARVLHAESRLRQLFARADTPYADLERVAVLLGDPQPESSRREVPRGRWSSHPDGYFIRFFPSGYSRTRIEVHVPETSATVRLDLADAVAVPAERGRQRLAMSGREH